MQNEQVKTKEIKQQPEREDEQPPKNTPLSEAATKRLTPDEINSTRSAMTEDILRYVKGGNATLRGIKLTTQEEQLLKRMSAEIRRARRKAEGEETPSEQMPIVQFNFQPESQKTWDNLIDRISVPALHSIIERKRNESITVRQSADRLKLGLLEKKLHEAPIMGNSRDAVYGKIKNIVERKIQTLAKRPEVADTYRRRLESLSQDRDRFHDSNFLAEMLYEDMRKANYPITPEYQAAWAWALSNKTIPSKEEGGWLYRGIFKSKETHKKTETRGSLNIHITPEVIAELDRLIKEGVIIANYKFGDPSGNTSSADRHDAVTIYFLDHPNEKGTRALAEIGKRYHRGDNLPGEKMGEGFVMSEIGSVRDEHLRSFLDELKKADPELERGIRVSLSPQGRLGMSEGTYYATKEALQFYGYTINYDQKKGFALSKMS